MTIEEQITALEARIQQCIIVASGCTEQAEQAAARAEQAAARAELATLGSQQAEVGSIIAAEMASVEAAVAMGAVEEVQETIEEIEEEVEEDASEILPQQGGSRDSGDETQSDDLLDGERETEEGTEPEIPIVITVEQHSPHQPTIFKSNRTRFHRGRTGRS